MGEEELVPILATDIGNKDPNDRDGKLPGWMIAVGLIVVIGFVGIVAYGILTGKM